MSKITKIEEVDERKKFDAIVKFDSRIVLGCGNPALAEIRIKGRTCYFHVTRLCVHERAAGLVRAYIKRMNGENKVSAGDLNEGLMTFGDKMATSAVAA